MKKLLLAFAVLFLMVGCSSSTKSKSTSTNTTKKDTTALPLTSTSKLGIYKEWYPGHKQLKISGRKNEQGQRVGIWKSYSKSGVELSIEMYTNGKKNGFTIVRYPNGIPRYTGNYTDDKKSGKWIFYNAHGQPSDTINYDKK